MTKKEDREIIFNKCGGRCAFCGIELGKGWHVSPIIPSVLVGTEEEPCLIEKAEDEADRIENKLPACKECSLSRIQLSHGKKLMSIDSFRRTVSFGFNTMLKNNPDYKKAIRYGLIKETGEPITFYFERERLLKNNP